MLIDVAFIVLASVFLGYAFHRRVRARVEKRVRKGRPAKSEYYVVPPEGGSNDAMTFKFRDISSGDDEELRVRYSIYPDVGMRGYEELVIRPLALFPTPSGVRQVTDPVYQFENNTLKMEDSARSGDDLGMASASRLLN